MCDGEGSSSAAYFKKPLVVCQTFLSFKCGEEEMSLSVSVCCALARRSDKLHLRSNNTLSFSFRSWVTCTCGRFHTASSELPFSQLSLQVGSLTLQEMKDALACCCTSVIAEEFRSGQNFPQCVFVLLGDGGRFTVPLLRSFGLESIPSWPEFGSGSCALRREKFCKQRMTPVSLVSVPCDAAAAEPLPHCAGTLHHCTDERMRISHRNLITQQQDWLDDNKSSPGRGSRPSVRVVWLLLNAQPSSRGFWKDCL